MSRAILKLLVAGILSLNQIAYSETDTVGIRRQLYEREGTFELGLGYGSYLNQSYVRTQGPRIVANWNFSRAYGVGLSYAKLSNRDLDTRYTVEHFYNRFDKSISATSGDGSDIAGRDANYGPAYVPINEYKEEYLAHFYYNIVYGKQLILRSFLSHFELYLDLAGGFATLDHYPERTILANGKPSHGNDKSSAGADIDETYAYGEEGRPNVIHRRAGILSLGIGQKFLTPLGIYFEIYLRNVTFVGQSPDNLFLLGGGIGTRL